MTAPRDAFEGATPGPCLSVLAHGFHKCDGSRCLRPEGHRGPHTWGECTGYDEASRLTADNATLRARVEQLEAALGEIEATCHGGSAGSFSDTGARMEAGRIARQAALAPAAEPSR